MFQHNVCFAKYSDSFVKESITFLHHFPLCPCISFSGRLLLFLWQTEVNKVNQTCMIEMEKINVKGYINVETK